MITLELRRAIERAAADESEGSGAIDPGLRPGGAPGQYASSAAFALAARVGEPPASVAAHLAARLRSEESWIEKAEVTGQGYVTVTATPQALRDVADRVTEAGRGCVRSDALAGRVFPEREQGTWEEAATWDQARELLAAEVTLRLAGAAGATAATSAGESARDGGDGGEGTIRSEGKGPAPAAAVAYAGRDAVRFSLVRVIPGSRVSVDPRKIARHHLGNPAYAVRYAHARAASGVRWAAAANPDQAGPQRPSADPGELALLDALSWLPDRVATAARRARPDEFARYLEHVAAATLAALTRAREQPPRRRRPRRAPGSDRLALAQAARTGLAAGLELLGVSAPDRLLSNTGEDQRHESCRSPGRPAARGRAASRPSASAADRPERA